MSQPQFIIEDMTDPVEIARHRVADERARCNGAWLQGHWADVLPDARGRYVAVAGEEAFIADSEEGARAMARTAHPDDTGLIAQYVLPERGPRIYAHRG